MKSIIGQTARGEYFFPRQNITNEIWSKLDSGSNLLLVAPRRVGKTSILFDLHDHPHEGCIVVYYTSESVNDQNEFYKKLFGHILEAIGGKKKFSSKVGEFLKAQASRIESVGLKNAELKLGEIKISYLNETIKLLDSLELKEEKLIVLIDEFAQTVENIIKDYDEKSAKHFLQTMREIRQSPKLYGKIQFVYAGSIGLENIAHVINGSNLINDLTLITVPALTKAESLEMTELLLEDSKLKFDDESFDYFLGLIEWFIPFHFQILLDEIGKIKTGAGKMITKTDVDSAVKNILKQRAYFEYWFERLRKAYEGNDFKFLKELLNFISLNQSVTSPEIVNMAIGYDLQDTYKTLVNILVHDGYINNADDESRYRFNSPLLKKWWCTNVAK